LTLPADIERRLLELAHTTEAKITPASLAYYAPCSIDDAAGVLEDLAVRERMGMEVEDDGTIVYHLHGRQLLTGRALPLPAPPTSHALATVERTHQRAASPLLAVVLAGVIPGAGHLYTGRGVAALLWFLVVAMGYVLILPGLVLHLFSMASAARSARRLNERSPTLMLAPAT